MAITIPQAEQAVLDLEKSSLNRLNAAVQALLTEIEAIEADNKLSENYPSVGRRLYRSIAGHIQLFLPELQLEVAKFNPTPPAPEPQANT